MTPNLEALRDLLVKARAATEGSRELDAAVAFTFDYRGVFGHAAKVEWAPCDDELILFDSDGNKAGCLDPHQFCPSYTTRPLDLTAVVGLVKEGWDWRVQMVGVLAMAAIIVPGNYVSDYETAPTPALALLIAVIEAHIYELESKNDQ